MKYPGRIVKAGEADAAIVKAIKSQLNKVLGNDPDLRLDPANPNFGPKMTQVVKLFQARNADAEGRPLKQDGEIGSLTWAALFGESKVPQPEPPKAGLLAEVLRVAAAEEVKKVREVPRNSNAGPAVSGYLKRTGLGPGHAWCCAFVYWCFDEAAKKLGRANPMFKTAGCLSHWNNCEKKGARRILKKDAVQNPGLLKPGMIFIMDFGGGKGHTGLIEKVSGGLLTTLEGNTDASRTREGGGLYRLTRKVSEINKGYIDYANV
jgi:hypothetical protein